MFLFTTGICRFAGSALTRSLQWKSRAYLFPAFAFTLVLVLSRNVSLVLEPRFWAEEGTTYFAAAYNHPWPSGLFSPHFGYYSIAINLIAYVAAKTVVLQHAPFVTTYASLLVLMVVAFIPHLVKSPFWPSIPQKLILSAALLVLSDGEVWLNSTCLNFYFGVGTFLILISSIEAEAPGKQTVALAYLGASGLSGVMSVFLLPAYFLRYITRRERFFRSAVILLSICSFVQVLCFYHCLLGNDLGPRFAGGMISHLPTAMIISLRNSGLPMWFGEGWHCRIYSGIYKALLLIFFALNWRTNRSYLSNLCFVTFMSCFASLNMRGSPRYDLLPSIMIACLVVRVLFEKRSKLALLILLLICCAKVPDYYLLNEKYYARNWSRYGDEVKAWKANPEHAIRIFPQGGKGIWEMHLAYTSE